jgi:hypothetical protein
MLLQLTVKLQKLLLKMVAGFPESQAWSEYRRTGYQNYFQYLKTLVVEKIFCLLRCS